MEKNILSITAIVVVVVFILLLIKLLKRIEAESPGRVWQESFKALAEELNASVKKNIMTGRLPERCFKMIIVGSPLKSFLLNSLPGIS
jgi:hypothetical protein